MVSYRCEARNLARTYAKWATFSLVAVPSTVMDRTVAVIARNKSIPTAALPKAVAVVLPVAMAAAITVGAVTCRPTATAFLHHATATGCQRAGVRIAIVRLANVVIDTADDDATVATEPQAATMEQRCLLIRLIPVQDPHVAITIAASP